MFLRCAVETGAAVWDTVCWSVTGVLRAGPGVHLVKWAVGARTSVVCSRLIQATSTLIRIPI